MKVNFTYIIIGWAKRWGFLPTSEAETKLSELRMKCCRKCEHAKRSKLMKLINGNANYELQLVCGVCSCPCLQKSLVVKEECPVSRW